MSEEKSGGGVSLATKSRYTSPEHFFPVIVDNFFDDPEALVDFGKSLPKEDEERQPGRRSRTLWEIDSNLCRAIILKIVSCYYDLDYSDFVWGNSILKFQEIPRFSENKNDVINKGWIHQDPIGDTYQLAGLIYLTPDIDPDSGTSLYNLKSTKSNKIYKTLLAKDTLFKEDNFDREEYTKSYIKHEKYFFEKLRVQNIFNRLVMYDTQEWHRANNYYNGDDKDVRLTLGFFIGGMSETPLNRIKNTEFDSAIKLQIENRKYEN